MNARSAATPTARPRNGWLYALRTGQLPTFVHCRNQRYEHVATFKHDFFAATGLYRGPGGLCVLKIGRTNDLVGLPMTLLGRFLARREIRFYEALANLPGVPRYIGPVGETGFLHEFVPGHPLGRDENVSDTFFAELAALIGAVHARDMAYVDLNKRQNVLVGDDGRPYLIDFQISLHIARTGWGRLPPLRWLLTRFQHGDVYHVLKHKRRLRPDQLTSDERTRVERVGFWIRLHRWISRPITTLRRRTLARLHRGDEAPVLGSAAK